MKFRDAFDGSDRRLSRSIFPRCTPPNSISCDSLPRRKNSARKSYVREISSESLRHRSVESSLARDRKVMNDIYHMNTDNFLIFHYSTSSTPEGLMMMLHRVVAKRKFSSASSCRRFVQSASFKCSMFCKEKTSVKIDGDLRLIWQGIGS